MGPLQYHHGQIGIQEESNTRHVADKLAHTHDSIADLSNFAAQLQAMSIRLDTEPPAGACSDGAQ